MPLRCKADTAFAAVAAAVGSHQVRQRAALIEEEDVGEVTRAEVGKRVDPRVALRLDVRPLLLGGVQRLFFRVKPSSASQLPIV